MYNLGFGKQFHTPAITYQNRLLENNKLINEIFVNQCNEQFEESYEYRKAF